MDVESVGFENSVNTVIDNRRNHDVETAVEKAGTQWYDIMDVDPRIANQIETDFESSFMLSLEEPLDVSSVLEITISDSIYSTLVQQGLNEDTATRVASDVMSHFIHEALHASDAFVFAFQISSETGLNGDAVMKEVIDQLYDLNGTPQNARHLSRVMEVSAEVTEAGTGERSGERSGEPTGESEYSRPSGRGV